MKKILHQKFEIDTITSELVKSFHDWLAEINHKVLNDEYVVVTTPTDLEVLEDNQAIITIDAKSYTLAELLETIEKASMYDDLCK